ncbi:MAG: N-acetylneuraminate synthase family protein [bacterium]
MQPMRLGNRPVGPVFPPLVIAEIGINHEGSFEKAVKMVDDAHQAGCECVKFQSHVIADEMIPNDVVPGNADTSIWEIMKRCALTEDEEFRLKEYVERKNMIFLSTPFSRAAADRLHGMDVVAFKIGSGECNNYPLVKHIAGFGKPIILSTGMNDLESIRVAVHILREADIGFALLHCTSMYPTPYDKVRLGALKELSHTFPGVPVGLSDHSVGNYTCFAAVALGASILEKHFTSDKSWPGPDIPISIDPSELRELVHGSKVIHEAGGGSKDVLPEEEPTIRFAHACVVSIRKIKRGDAFSMDNIWVKRPGTGEIKASQFETLLGKVATKDIAADVQIRRRDFK